MSERDDRPIVVGVDGEETGQRALRWALAEGARRGCPVRVVHAWAFEPMTDFMWATSKDLHDRSAELLRFQVEAATRGMTELPEIVRLSLEGHPGRVLTEAAADAAMLVVGSHRGGLLREMVLGSVSADCVHHATCPVVVIPASIPVPQARTEGAGEQAEVATS